MKNIHATITFAVLDDRAAEALQDKLRQVVQDVDPSQIADIQLEFQEEILFSRLAAAGSPEDEVSAGLSFDGVFEPKSDSF